MKPMITTCDMRHLYNAKPKNETLILQAKEYERRRCNHQDLEEPLSTLECLSSVVDPKDNNTNKHRYVVASNDLTTRKQMRRIAGVPLIYIAKSVVLMEPMANASEEQREREEKSKFKQGLKGQRKPDAGQKRKREDGEEENADAGGDQSIAGATGDARTPKTKRQKGLKGPNPLSVKKAKKENAPAAGSDSKKTTATKTRDLPLSTTEEGQTEDGQPSAPRKRKRKHKSKIDDGAAPADDVTASP